MFKDDLWSNPEDMVYDDEVSTGLVKQKVNTPAIHAPNSELNKVVESKESISNVSLSSEQTKLYTTHENSISEPIYFNPSQSNLDTTSIDNFATRNNQTHVTSSSTSDLSSVSAVLTPSPLIPEDLWESYVERRIVPEPLIKIEEPSALVQDAVIPDANRDIQAPTPATDHVGSTLELEEDLWARPDEHQSQEEELIDASDDDKILFQQNETNEALVSFVSDREDNLDIFTAFDEVSTLREFENALETDPLLNSFQLLDIQAELAELEKIAAELADKQFEAEHSNGVFSKREMVQAPGWMGSSSIMNINWENEETAKREALERLGYSKLHIIEATSDFIIQAARAYRLTHREELALTTRLAHARSHLNQLHGLDYYETKRKELEAEIAALEQALMYNLQWVAVKKAPQFLGQGVELDDLIQYGMLGIAAGIRHFDINRKARLLVVVNWWVFQALTRAVSDYGRLIRFPVYIHESLVKMEKQYTELEMFLGRHPTREELAKALQISIDQQEELLRVYKKCISLDLYIRNEYANDGYSFQPVEETLVAGEDIVNGRIDEISIREEVDVMLDFLKPRERTVIELRYDLDDQKGEMRTLEEVGKVMHVTRERIRQIEERALKKIRQSITK